MKDKEFPLKHTLVYILKKMAKFWSNLKNEYKYYEKIGIFEEIRKFMELKKTTLNKLDFSELETKIDPKPYKKMQIKLLFEKGNCTQFDSKRKSIEIITKDILHLFEKFCIVIR